jgi:hypothetical protein
MPDPSSPSFLSQATPHPPPPTPHPPQQIQRAFGPKTTAKTTHLLMAQASARRSRTTRDFFTRSDPARSTRFNFPLMSG